VLVSYELHNLNLSDFKISLKGIQLKFCNNYVSFQEVSISPPFLRVAFLYESFSLHTVWLCIFLQKKIGTKDACKKFVKLTTLINFINVLHTAFKYTDPKSAKTDGLTVFFCFWDLSA